MALKIILATDKELNIGYQNKLLFFYPKDLKRFVELTKGQTIVCGRNTWDSLPKKLPNRKNLVLTSSLYMRGKQYHEFEKKPDGFLSTINEIISLSKKEDVWVIGGAMLYNELFQYADVIEHTLVDVVAENADTKVDNIDKIIGEHFTHIELQTIKDVDRMTGNENTLEFRTYRK